MMNTKKRTGLWGLAAAATMALGVATYRAARETLLTVRDGRGDRGNPMSYTPVESREQKAARERMAKEAQFLPRPS